MVYYFITNCMYHAHCLLHPLQPLPNRACRYIACCHHLHSPILSFRGRDLSTGLSGIYHMCHAQRSPHPCPPSKIRACRYMAFSPLPYLFYYGHLLLGRVIFLWISLDTSNALQRVLALFSFFFYPPFSSSVLFASGLFCD